MEGSQNDLRLERATLLAVHAIARPQQKSEPIPREEMAAWNKLLAEVVLEKEKMILGCLFDFWCLKVSLPENKFVAWLVMVKESIKKCNTNFKELEQMIGRLVHLGMILPYVHHFLSRLQDLQVSKTLGQYELMRSVWQIFSSCCSS